MSLSRARAIVRRMKNPLDRIRELEGNCEVLENALAEIKAVTFEPRQTLPPVKRRIAKILLAVRDRGGKPDRGRHDRR